MHGREVTLPQDSLEFLPTKSYAFGFIKPSHTEVAGLVLQDIEDAGLDIILCEETVLSPTALEYMYRESTAEQFYPAMQEYLSTNTVVAFIATAGGGVDAQDILSRLKKEDGEDGLLRKKYQKRVDFTDDDIALWEQGVHPKQEYMTIALTQSNVIHTADTESEAMKSIELIWGGIDEES